MKIELYSIKDVCVGFSQPFACINDDVALRQFIATVRAERPNFCNTFPEHKELWKLGHMDDQDGKIFSKPKFMAKAISYVVVSEYTKQEDPNGTSTENS